MTLLRDVLQLHYTEAKLLSPTFTPLTKWWRSGMYVEPICVNLTWVDKLIVEKNGQLFWIMFYFILGDMLLWIVVVYFWFSIEKLVLDYVKAIYLYSFYVVVIGHFWLLTHTMR